MLGLGAAAPAVVMLSIVLPGACHFQLRVSVHYCCSVQMSCEHYLLGAANVPVTSDVSTILLREQYLVSLSLKSSPLLIASLVCSLHFFLSFMHILYKCWLASFCVSCCLDCTTYLICSRRKYCPNIASATTGLQNSCADPAVSVPCNAGYYCPVESSSPVLCPIGAYCALALQGDFEWCPSGTYCRSAGLTAPLNLTCMKGCAPSRFSLFV